MTTEAQENHLLFLHTEFSRIDVLIQREVRRWLLAGQDPQDDYRGLYITQAEAEQLLHRPFGVSWGQLIDLPPAEETRFAEALTQATQQAEELAAQMTAQGQMPRLQQVATAFGLDRTALDMLLLCLAPAFDTKYERLYGYLQDNVTRRRPSVRLLLDLLGRPGIARFALMPYLHKDAPLFHYGLLEYVVEPPPANMHWINQTLNPDDTLSAWLRGRYQPPALLGEHAVLTMPAEDSKTPSLALNTAADLGALQLNFVGDGQALPAQQPILVFQGEDEVTQQATVWQWVSRLARPLLTVDLSQVVGEGCTPLQAVRLALRDARLTGAIPCLCGWQACLNTEGQVQPAVLAALCEQPGLVIVCGRTRWQPGGIPRQRPIFHYDFGMPAYEQRLAFWQHWVAEPLLQTNLAVQLVSPAADESQVANLAGQFTLTSGQIRDAVAAAKDLALQAGRPLETGDLFAAARAYSNPRLNALAHKLNPRYAWSDLVLPADQLALLRELVETVRGRAKVLGDWGFGQKLAASAGITALFAGPPGTGKTLAAEVVAGDLGLDLYKIDLSSVVSKYIGETEKNLERIFVEATSSNAILFFDEADALFGKRSEVKDAHDRYANIEISYLLQRMERYDGVAILASNLRGNLDDAFTRRLHFIVSFPFPQRAERRRIWETLVPPKTPLAADVDFDRLAQRFELAGGNIRNAILAAGYLAASDGQVVTMAHLLHGVKRELQKMGRLVGELG